MIYSGIQGFGGPWMKGPLALMEHRFRLPVCWVLFALLGWICAWIYNWYKSFWLVTPGLVVCERDLLADLLFRGFSLTWQCPHGSSNTILGRLNSTRWQTSVGSPIVHLSLYPGPLQGLYIFSTKGIDPSIQAVLHLLCFCTVPWTFKNARWFFFHSTKATVM